MSGITELEALRAIGCTDKEIRKRAECIAAVQYDPWAEEDPAYSAQRRFLAAILRAAEQLGPEPEWVTRDTPLGTEVLHGSTAPEAHVLVGWDGDDVVLRDGMGAYFADNPVGWHVVKGAEG